MQFHSLSISKVWFTNKTAVARLETAINDHLAAFFSMGMFLPRPQNVFTRVLRTNPGV